MESRLHSTPRGEKRQTAQAHCNRGRFGANPVERQETQVRGALRAPGGYWFSNRRGAFVSLNLFRVRLPFAFTPPQPLAGEGTGAQYIRNCAHIGYSPISRN